MYKCRPTDIVLIANMNGESNELTLLPSYMCLFLGGYTVKQAIYRCHRRMIS